MSLVPSSNGLIPVKVDKKVLEENKRDFERNARPVLERLDAWRQRSAGR